MENVEAVEVVFFNLLESQEGLEKKVRDLEPELALAVRVFTNDVSGLVEEVNAALTELGEQVRKVTTGVLVELEKANDGVRLNGGQVTRVVERLEGAASRHFIELNYFYAYISQVMALVNQDALMLPSSHDEIYKVVCGTSAIKRSLKAARHFTEKELSELKKELV